jgi:hypothetical protein
MYSGYFIKNLLDVVCQNCGKDSGDHSYVGNLCPSMSVRGALYLETTYADDLEAWYARVNPKIVQCQAAEGPDATQCGRSSVVGERLCPAHLEDLETCAICGKPLDECGGCESQPDDGIEELD